MHNHHNGITPGLAAPSRLPSPAPDRIAPLAAAGTTHARIDRLPETATPADEAGGDQGNTRTDMTDSAFNDGTCLDKTRQRIERADKAFTTLRATLAMRGFELHVVGDGEGGAAYMVHRWSMSRTLPSLGAVRAFAQQVGGAQHG